MARNAARERPAMELRVSGITDGEHAFAFEVEAERFALDRFEGPVTVTGTLRKVSHQVFVQAELAGTLVGECDRCLAPVRSSVRAPMSLFYHVSLEARPPRPDDDVEIQTLHPEQDSIVLDDEVRQTLLLHVPLKVLCRDDCPGLCPRCGAALIDGECTCEDATVDPRWEKLSDLLRKKDED